MLETTVELLEVRLEGKGLVSGRIAVPAGLAPKPGQYLLGRSLTQPEPLPRVLFPARSGDSELLVAPSLPPAWHPGMALNLRGPLGKGFHLPPTARRVALAALDAHPYRLLPLLNAALAQGMEIALFTSFVPANLPAAVEVLAERALPEAAPWADYLAIDLPVENLSTLRQRLGLLPGRALAPAAEILVFTAMPCGGRADCGICALKTVRGWGYACKDGPVFDFHSLELT